LFFFFLCLFVLGLAWADAEEGFDPGLDNDKVISVHECSRIRSRMARNALVRIMKDKILDKYTLPPKCPFKENKDMYIVYENAKIKAGLNRYTCNFCKKSFRSELFLDRHFDNRHMNYSNEFTNVCLADYCDILRCSPSNLTNIAEKQYESEIDHQKLNDQLCQESGIEERKIFCRGTLHRCFPLDASPLAEELYNYFNQEMCEKLTCETVGAAGWVGSEMMEVLKIIFFVLLAIGLIIYYVILHLFRWDSKAQDELRRRRGAKPEKPPGASFADPSTASSTSSAFAAMTRPVQRLAHAMTPKKSAKTFN